MHNPFGDAHLNLDYPCDWTYKIVGRDEEAMQLAVSMVLDREYRLNPSNRSRTGKYLSLEIVLEVRDEDDRRGVGQALHDRDEILFVI